MSAAHSNSAQKEKPDTRACTACKRELPISEFPIWGGRLRFHCRECWRAYRKLAYRKNIEHNRAIARAKLARIVAKTPDFYAKKRAAHPEKVRAKELVWNEVIAGRMIRPDNCQKCGVHKSVHRIEASHDDYSQPLVIEWLCAACHRAKDYAAAQARRHVLAAPAAQKPDGQKGG